MDISNTELIDEYLMELYSEQKYEDGLGEYARNEDSVEFNDITIQQSESLLQQKSTGGVIWRATPLFSSWIQKSELRSLVQDKTVVELGSGTGALAMLLANFANKIIATDQKPLLKLLKRNCSANNIEIQEFDWVDDDFGGVEDEGCIITCDTIYNDYLIDHLINAILSVMESSPNIKSAIVCVQLRVYEIMDRALNAFAMKFNTVKAYKVGLGVECYLLEDPIKLN